MWRRVPSDMLVWPLSQGDGALPTFPCEYTGTVTVTASCTSRELEGWPSSLPVSSALSSHNQVSLRQCVPIPNQKSQFAT